MIVGTERYVEGVRFLEKIEVLKPDDTIGGVGVHRVDYRLTEEPAFMKAIRLMGLRKVGDDLPHRCYLYAQYPMPYFLIKVVQVSARVYWASLRWLYDNGRVFKEIPPGEFSWKYFTPYTWLKKK